MRWSSLRIRSNRSSALRCPSWRRNTLTICSRLLERLPPSGFSLLRSGSAGDTLTPGRERTPSLMVVAAAALAVHAERRTAAAGGSRIGVTDGEPAAGDRVDEIDFGALQVAHADRVDVQLHAVRLEHLVAHAAALFDHQAVLEPRAAAALHEHAQTAADLVLFGQQLVDFLGCRTGHVDHSWLLDLSIIRPGLPARPRRPFPRRYAGYFRGHPSSRWL